MKKISAEVCAVTHAGRVHTANEDNYSLNGQLTCDGTLRKGSAYVQKMTQPFHLAVCDGMGGEAFGEVASGIASQSIAASAMNVYESGEDFSFAVARCLEDANNRICSERNARGARMGTTVAGIYAMNGRIVCVSLGDTRIYRYTGGILEQVSFDHTHGQEFIDSGAVSGNSKNTIPNAKRLTKYLGVFPEESTLNPSVSVIDNVSSGDILLLCSDGLNDMVSDTEIRLILSGAENAQDATGKLVKKALEYGGKDNVTIITAFLSCEDTSVFVPIANKIVGDTGADYREEYENSYTPAENEEGSSPYANADANAYKQKPDVRRILTFAGIAVVVLAVVALAAFMIKTALDKYHAGANEVDTRNSASQSSDAIDWDVDIYGTTAPVTEIMANETTTEEITTAPATEMRTTRRYISTTRRYVQTTARRVYTTARSVPSTTAAPVETTAENTTAAQTQPATTDVVTTATAGTTQANETQSSTTQANVTQPVSAASTTAAATPTTPATTGANELPLDVNH